MKTCPQTIWNDLEKIRANGPLVHSITNYVVMNSTANALLALGASPIMAHEREEMKEMVGISSALVLNIGTLSSPWIQSMKLAGQYAKERKIPVVLDPVGSGASKIRTTTARSFLEEGIPTVVRGNASEIQSLVSDLVMTKGVDSTSGTEAAMDAGMALSERFNCAVSISGEVDVMIHKGQVATLRNGHPIMTKVTGMGCTSTTYVAAFNAINADPMQASLHAMAVMGIAGEMAFKRSQGPGSFIPAFCDVVYNLTLKDIETHLKVNEL